MNISNATALLAGQAVSHLICERRDQFAALERTVPTVATVGLDPAYVGRRGALHCAVMTWGMNRLRVEVELTRAQGKLEAAELVVSLAARGMKRRNAGRIKDAAQEAKDAARQAELWAASNVAALELALDDAAQQFHFEAHVVRTVMGLPRFTSGDIAHNASVRELANQLFQNVVSDLEKLGFAKEEDAT